MYSHLHIITIYNVVKGSCSENFVILAEKCPWEIVLKEIKREKESLNSVWWYDSRYGI